MIDVLIIEDDHDTALLCAMQMEHVLGERLNTRLAASLGASLEVLNSGFDPDLVTLDLNLPDATGVESIARLRSRLPDTYLLIMSGYDSDKIMADCISRGANGYVRKGSGLGVIAKQIQQWRENRCSLQDKTDRLRT